VIMRSALVTLKQYRFEVAFALTAALVAAGIGLTIDLRLDALGVSQECLDEVNNSVDTVTPDDECFASVGAGVAILGSTYLRADGVLPLSVMGVLPFVVGLFAGLPVVARELEDHTAQTAWWLNGSRRRWLLRQLGPIVVVLGAAIAVAALAAIPVAEDWARWYGGEGSTLIGLHGPLTLVRAFGAFGLGLAMGALLGRTFPAFVASVALLALVVAFAGQAHESWLERLPLEPLWTQSANGHWQPVGGMPRAVAWGAPDGAVLTQEGARQRATAAGVPPAGPDDPVDAPASAWLEEQGYSEITLGTTDQAALGWAPYDATIFAILGALGLTASFALVNRRRPT
jgi:hypothetical protein